MTINEVIKSGKPFRLPGSHCFMLYLDGKYIYQIRGIIDKGGVPTAEAKLSMEQLSRTDWEVQKLGDIEVWFHGENKSGIYMGHAKRVGSDEEIDFDVVKKELESRRVKNE